jgi:cytochrome P450/nitrite reductase/ring-hydroxylating ferredoxin subunit
MTKIRVASVNELEEGRVLRVDPGGRPLLLSQFDGRFYAIEAICSHAGGRLEDGEIVNRCVICPIHGAIFSLATGKVAPETNWASNLEAFAVEVIGIELFVELPEIPANKASGPEDVPAAATGARLPDVAARIHFDPMAPEQRECPFDLYARARRETPICYSERFDLWLVTRYQDIVAILKDPARFSSAQSLAVDDAAPPEVQAVLDNGFPATPTMVTADPPTHTRFRELVGKAFTSRRILQIEPRMREIAHRLIDGFFNNGHVDLVRHFAYPLPMQIIAEILGVPAEHMEWFKRWSDDMTARFGPLPLERQIECAQSEVEFQHYFAERLEERRRDARNDFLTDLLNARIKGEAPLNMAEMLSILKQLLIGGNETSTNLISSMVVLLMNNPAQFQAVTNDRRLVQNVVEEALRLESPVQGLFRTTTEDVEIGGVRLPKGAHLELLYASGNRDDARFINPDAFDVRRNDSSNHMAFGFGIHFCIGAPLARSEGRIALEALLERLPGMHLAPGQNFEHHPHFFLRGLKHLELQWDFAHSDSSSTIE